MTNEEIIEALRNNPENKTAYMNELYNQNKGLIYKIALKHTEKADIEDLMQEAYLFLDEAANSYEGNYGAKFSTYFSHMLFWRLSAYVFYNSSPIKIPLRFKDLIKKYNAFILNFQQKHNCEPKESDIMRTLDLSVDEFKKLISTINLLEVSSIDSPAPFDESLTLSDIIASEDNFSKDIEDESEKEYRNAEIKKAWGKLREIERAVIDQFYFQGNSLEKIAHELNISPSYCSAVKKQALKNLKKDNDLIRAVTNYNSYADYHYSVTRFKNTRLSSVEFRAIKNEEAIEWQRKYLQEMYSRKFAV